MVLQSIAILAPKFWLESPFVMVCCANIVEERGQTGVDCAFVGIVNGDWKFCGSVAVLEGT